MNFITVFLCIASATSYGFALYFIWYEPRRVFRGAKKDLLQSLDQNPDHQPFDSDEFWKGHKERLQDRSLKVLSRKKWYLAGTIFRLGGFYFLCWMLFSATLFAPRVTTLEGITPIAGWNVFFLLSGLFVISSIVAFFFHHKRIPRYLSEGELDKFLSDWKAQLRKKEKEDQDAFFSKFK